MASVSNSYIDQILLKVASRVDRAVLAIVARTGGAAAQDLLPDFTSFVRDEDVEGLLQFPSKCMG